MVQTPDTSVVFDPTEEGFIQSPYEQFARLRRNDPVHWSNLLSGWVLTRYDDIAPMLREPSVSVEIENADPSPIIENEMQRRAERNRGNETLVLRDDPDHARLRRLIQAPFSARAVQDLHGLIQQHVSDALDAVLPEAGTEGEMDVVADFAYPLPVTIFCEMLGLPAEASPRFRSWTMSVARALDPVMSDEERDRVMGGIDEMGSYLEERVEEKRRDPTDDMLSDLVHAEEDGEQLTHDELMAQLMTLYVAGHEPTAALIGNGLAALLDHPDQLAALQADPTLIKNAVLELLRYDGPNQFVRRIATHPMTVGERRIEPGQVMYASLAAANRDPERWGDDVDELRIDRPDAAQHLQFSAGIHSCLGSHLARLQAELALGALFARVEKIEPAGEPVWSERMVIRSVARLPIRFRVRATD